MPKAIISLRVSLEPQVYREIDISGEASLYKLAGAINQVFGFDFDHAFGFYDNVKDPYRSKTIYELFTDMGEDPTRGARSVKRTKVAEAFEKDGKRLCFLFDYGDEWLFEVKRLSARDQDAPKAFWKLVKSVGDAPPQYPDPEEEEEDGRPFAEKYEMIKVGELTVVRRREEK